MSCHTTSNLQPNCLNRAFLTRLRPSLVPSVRRKSEVIRMHMQTSYNLSTAAYRQYKQLQSLKTLIDCKDTVVVVLTGRGKTDILYERENSNLVGW